MSRSVNINLELLKAIVKLDSRRSLLKVADKSLVTAICECALNILNGNVEITQEQKEKLRKYKTFLRLLAKSKTPWQERRKAIVNKGNTVIPLLVEAALENHESSEEDGVDLP